MALKIIGAGLPRTGTLSLKHALEQLGYNKCHHMFEVMANIEQADVFIDAADGKEVDWDSVFQDKYQASCDAPSMMFYKQLMTKYPDAKIILTVRDPSAWYDSVKSTIWGSKDIRISADDNVQKKMKKMSDLFFTKMLNNRFEDVEYTINFFNQHVEEVKRIVPQDKLLVFQVSDGWEPLCKFLGVEIPDSPFPSKNSKKAMHNKIEALKTKGHDTVDSDLINS